MDHTSRSDCRPAGRDGRSITAAQCGGPYGGANPTPEAPGARTSSASAPMVDARPSVIPCDRQRRKHGERAGAAARLVTSPPARVAAAACRVTNNLAARQGRAALYRNALRGGGACAPTPTPAAQKVTAPTPTHNYQGTKPRDLGRGGTGGTGLEPRRKSVKCMILQRNSTSGTVEPWNRVFPYARALARVIWFHGSTVPEGYIDRVFQSLSLLLKRFQPGSTRFHNRKWVQN